MNIYVSNLAFHVGDEELKKIFSSFGSVASAKIIKDRETNKSRGFGFVEMENESEAEKSIKELNGSYFEGKTISVNEAKPKPREERPARKQFNNFWK